MSLLVAEQRLEAVHARVMIPLEHHVDPLRYAMYCQAGEEKYGEPFWIAEEIKNALRRDYAARAVPRRFAAARAESMEFWAEYEEVNRVWLPEDPVYATSVSAKALGTTANVDYSTLSCGSSGMDRIIESFIGGEMTASTVTRTGIQRATGGTTPTNQTPEKLNTRSPAAVSTSATAWTASPTGSGNPAIIHSLNTFGGSDRWVPSPGEEMYLVNSEIVSWKQLTTTAATVSAFFVWEEL